MQPKSTRRSARVTGGVEFRRAAALEAGSPPLETLVSRLDHRLLFAAALCTAAITTQAATITVTSTAYGNLADGACNLFEAVQAANNNAPNFDCPAGDPSPTVDTIVFAIPGSGVHTIIQSVALSPTESVIIDGFTQPGAAPNTNTPAQGGLNGSLRIELVAASNANVSATLGVGQVLTLRGLVMRGALSAAVFVNGGRLDLEGCYVGTSVDGLASGGTTPVGVSLAGPAALRIGGTAPAQRNLFGGLAESAVRALIGSPDSVLAGNLFGTDRTGLVALPIGAVAVDARIGAAADNLRIGGPTVAERNVFGGAALQAIRINAVGSDIPPELVGDGVVVQGNFVGVGVDGVTPIPNATLSPTPPGATASALRYGSTANSTGRARIGGTAAGEGNLIAFNGGAGIELSGSGVTAEAIGNVIVGNDGLAIDLGGNGPDGPTANDPGDADPGGANRYQNYPQFSRYLFTPGSGSAGAVELDLVVDSATANADYPLRVDVYEALATQALRHLGSTAIDAADAGQTVTRSFAVAADPRAVVATAIDAAGRTSELSLPFPHRVFADGFETP